MTRVQAISRSEELYKKVLDNGANAIDEFIATRQSEELFLDFKRSSDNGSGMRLSQNDRNNLSEAIIGRMVVPKSPKHYFSPIRHWRIVPLAFVETSLFSRIRERYLDDENFRLLQASLMTSPHAGALIRESGGIRKLRWGADGSGKRGGLRIIYYSQVSANRIYLLTIYRKLEMSDLSRAELRGLKGLVREIARARTE